MHQRCRKRHAHLAVIPRAAVTATAPAATATARFVAIHADLSKKRCRSPRNTSIDVGSHPKKIDKYQDDINDPQRGFSRNVVEPPRIPQTLTSFDLRVHLWSSLHDFVIGDGTWHPLRPHLNNVFGAANLQHWPMMQTYAKRLTPVTMFVETRGKMLLAKSFHCCSVRMF